MFGFGKLDIDTLSGAGSLQLEFVHKPAKLQKQIMDEVHRTTKNAKSQ